MQELTFGQRSRCHHFLLNHPNSLNKHQNVQLPFHLQIGIGRRQLLNEFRLAAVVDMKKSNRIVAEVASSEQSAAMLMVYMMETLPEPLAN